MKRKLLLLSLIAYSTLTIAQTKTWDFGNDGTNWPLSSGIGSSEMVVDNLGLYPISTNTNFGAVTANNYTFAADNFSSVKRFQLNGGGSPAAGTYLPTQRYLYFTASGACTVKVWFRTGSGGARSLFITDGTTLIASAGTDATGTSGDPFILTGNVSAAQAAGGKIYIYGDQAQNLYKITVTGATVNTVLSSESFQNGMTANAYSNDNKVFLSNITEAIKVNVYNITGQLVKSLNTSTDTNFELNNSGFYIVNMESSEGRKSVKIALN